MENAHVPWLCLSHDKFRHRPPSHKLASNGQCMIARPPLLPQPSALMQSRGPHGSACKDQQRITQERLVFWMLVLAARTQK